ncbi:hypothetical protein SDC9_65232 [bioreactor metagenome]|uniref:Uncharacterized protein n=1 Tax=bioreactor metagenome TaxID=1076179 RepID=A0A644XRH5_9ZZZZ
MFQAEEGEDEHRGDHRQGHRDGVLDEAVVDQQHRDVDHQVAQDRPDEQVPDPGGGVQIAELHLDGMRHLGGDRPGDQCRALQQEGEDQAAQRVAEEAGRQHPQGPPGRRPAVVVRDADHHHVGGEQLRPGEEDEHQRPAEDERAEHLPEADEADAAHLHGGEGRRGRVVGDIEQADEEAGHRCALEVAHRDPARHVHLGVCGLEGVLDEHAARIEAVVVDLHR